MAVPALVVEEDVGERRTQRVETADQACAGERVALDLVELALVQRPGLLEHRIVEAELADIVKECANPETAEPRALPAEATRNNLGERANSIRMAPCVGITRLDRLRKRSQHHVVGLRARLAVSLFRIPAA
jgi:hypothetical protein